jgi:hypothetical protein
MGFFQIKVGRVVVILSLILVTGYMVIFWSILRSDAPKLPDRSEEIVAFDKAAKLRLDRALGENVQIDKELQDLKAQLKAANEKVESAEAATAAAESEKVASVVTVPPQAYRPGVIVLGMHRSGTSIIGGLMNKMGLNAGGPLIRPWHDNEKGFFERVDVVVQNDAIMQEQSIDYAQGTFRFDHLKGLKEVLNHYESATGSWFDNGRAGTTCSSAHLLLC